MGELSSGSARRAAGDGLDGLSGNAPPDPVGLTQVLRVTGGIEAVFLNNREALLRFFRASGGNDSEDLLQELWLQVSSRPATPIAEPAAYLYRMANNLVLSRRRSAHRRQRREQGWTDATTAPDDIASSVDSGERLLLAREQVRAVEAALSGLGEKTDRIFRRFRLEGVAQHEIAREMGISVSAVEKHLQKAYRALLELRKKIDAE